MTNAARLKSLLFLWLRRSGLIVFASIALLLALTLAATYFVLNTESGTLWALRSAQRALPELSFVHVEGSLLHGVSVEKIRWRDADIDIELDRVQLQLRFTHLLHGEIHLTTLHTDALNITPLGPGSDDPVKLPLLFLPFRLSIADLAVRQFNIIDDDSTFSLNDIQSTIKWRATTLTFTETKAGWNEANINTRGRIGFRGDYPLRLEGELTSPRWPAPIRIRSQGNLRQLELIASSDKPAKLSAQIKLATLDRNLPLSLRAELLEPFAQAISNEKISIEKATLEARGDLTQMQAQLELSASDTRNGDSRVSATAQWRDDHRITLDAQWIPATGHLQMHCDGSLQKPVNAHCNGAAAALSLTPWMRGQTLELSGAIALEASWLDPQWMLSLQLPDIRGKYNTETLTGALDLRTDDGSQWQLHKLALALGPNVVTANGEFGDRHRLRASIDAPDLSRIDSQLDGSVAGDISLSGEASPTITARLRGSQWRWQDFHVTAGSIDIQLVQSGQAKSTGHIDIKQLSRAESQPVDLTLDISGEKSDQQWTLRAAQATNTATLACRTQAAHDWNEWQYVCSDFSGELHAREKQLELAWRNTAALRGNADIQQKRFELAPFCLHASGVEACLDQSLRIIDAKPQAISAHARGLPLQWASAWLPDTIELLDDPRGSAQIQLRSLTPLDAQASIALPATRWRWRTLRTTEITDVDAIDFNGTLSEQRAVFSTAARSSRIGNIAAQLTVNDPRNRRLLDGRVDINALQLSGVAWAFEGLDSISGEINGSIAIGGTAAAPQLRGQVLLKDGHALWAPLGSPFRTVHGDLTFDNNSAKLGGWFALGQGGGDIDGDVVWDGAGENWKLRLGLVAGGVSAMPLANSTIVFSPHTELIAQPGEMHIEGYIDVASADIRLKELPPETTDVSQDQEIVGQQLDDEWKIWTRLDLNLGDQFHLNGFGADVNLSGRMRMEKAPGDNMHLYGEVKVPRGRYRAYGQRLIVRRGAVIFYGPPDNPDLNLEAVRDLPPGNNDVVGMRVIGSLKTPEAILFSEPSMPDSDIAYYLLTGRKPVANSTGTGGFTASGALLSLGLAGSESKAGQLAEKFGITDLQLGTSENASGESEAEISGQLGKDLFVRYGRGLGEQSNSISFQYRLTPKLMIETISGVEDALDLLYSFEIK